MTVSFENNKCSYGIIKKSYDVILPYNPTVFCKCECFNLTIDKHRHQTTIDMVNVLHVNSNDIQII